MNNTTSLTKLREQKPVAWMYTDAFGTHLTTEWSEVECATGVQEFTPLYTRTIPAPAPAVPVEWREFARNIAENYDCDEDAHKYGTTCRACDARALLQPAGGAK